MARLFGLRGDSWRRHANPLSVWTRFAVMVLLFEDMTGRHPECARWEH